MRKDPIRIELSLKDQQALLERIKTRTTTEEDADILKGLLDFNRWLQYSLEEKNISIHKLQKIFGNNSEKRNKKDKNNKAKDKVDEKSRSTDEKNSDVSEAESISNSASVNQDTLPEIKPKKYVPNNGRLSHEKYTNASVIHRECSYRPGDPCPEEGCQGKLKAAKPGCVIKIVGQSFAKANKYILNTVRCGLCDKGFSAQLPEGVCAEKYDPVFKAELCVHKYFLGVPNNRLESYQRLVGVPLPDSTQFDKIEDVGNVSYYAFNHLEIMGANGRLAHGDDTRVRIKSIIQANKGLDKKARTGMFTTGLMCLNENHKIYLFYSGRKHCGENMLDLLKKRDPSLPKIQYMCDALNSNMPASLKAIFINCLAHGRRNFSDIEKFYPKECAFVIDVISIIYKNDKEAKEKALNDEQRLKYHQEHSEKPMNDLQAHLRQQLDEHIVEPNSPLGKAYNYMLNHWHKLTQFLRIAGAPLDNNTLEQALKIPIRVRKNSYFYATEHGAYIGSMLQSLICTCIGAKQNPVEYLTALQVHKSAVRLNPGDWMPWNYKETIATMLEKSLQALAQAA